MDCDISSNIVIRVLEYRASGGGYLKLAFLNTIGGVYSVLISKTQADVSIVKRYSLSVLKLHPDPVGACTQFCVRCLKPLPSAKSDVGTSNSAHITLAQL